MRGRTKLRRSTDGRTTPAKARSHLFADLPDLLKHLGRDTQLRDVDLGDVREVDLRDVRNVELRDALEQLVPAGWELVAHPSSLRRGS